MASFQPQRLLQKGDHVYCEGRTCFIQHISNTLGFNEYHMVDIDSGVLLKRPRYKLEYVPVEVLAVGALADDTSFDEEIKENETVAKSPKNEGNTKKRFASVSVQELDEIELNRNSSRTKMQTNWGVGVFRGISYVFFTFCTLIGNWVTKLTRIANRLWNSFTMSICVKQILLSTAYTILWCILLVICNVSNEGVVHLSFPMFYVFV